MDFKRAGSQPSGAGPSEYFTGTVRVDPLFEAAEPGRALGVKAVDWLEKVRDEHYLAQ